MRSLEEFNNFDILNIIGKVVKVSILIEWIDNKILQKLGQGLVRAKNKGAFELNHDHCNP